MSQNLNFDLILNKIEDLFTHSKQSKAVEAVLLTQLNQDEDRRHGCPVNMGWDPKPVGGMVLASGKWVPGTEPSQVHKPACCCAWPCSAFLSMDSVDHAKGKVSFVSRWVPDFCAVAASGGRWKAVSSCKLRDMI